jgi:hypothetical protein
MPLGRRDWGNTHRKRNHCEERKGSKTLLLLFAHAAAPLLLRESDGRVVGSRLGVTKVFRVRPFHLFPPGQAQTHVKGAWLVDGHEVVYENAQGASKEWCKDGAGSRSRKRAYALVLHFE